MIPSVIFLQKMTFFVYTEVGFVNGEKLTELQLKKKLAQLNLFYRDGFLIDETGNRRFLVIPCETDLHNQVDFHSLEIERDSIWSAAFKAYKNKEPHYLTSDQEQQVAEDNLSYLIESPWTQPIISYLQTPNNKFKDITIELLLTEAIEKPKAQQKKSDTMQISSILKTLGYERKRKRIDGNPKWVWEHLT